MNLNTINAFSVKLTADWMDQTKIVTNFAYSGGRQSYKVPVTGYYKLETWGAAGAGNNAGKGGYSVGEMTLQKDTDLYVYVGGQGTQSTDSNHWLGGGYNGGGNSYMAGGGGGMTHITTSPNDSCTDTITKHTDITERKSAGTETVTNVVYQGRTAGSSSWSDASNKAWTPVKQFTATEAGTVSWVSNDPRATSKSIDPVGRILVNGAVATQNDDSNGYNFSMSTTVNAGDLVSIEISSYRETGDTVSSASYSHPAFQNATSYATHAENITFNTSALLIAAGGGGGNTTSTTAKGGSGGGTTGTTVTVQGSANNSLSGTQSGGYKQCLGESGDVLTYAAGAGGGFYGGRASKNTNGGAGGGSGYLASGLLNKNTLDGTQTFGAPGGGNETGHSGNGYARITWLRRFQ